MSKCKGCPACREGKIPRFETEEEEEAFWDSHSADQFPTRPVKVRLRGRPPKEEKREHVHFMLLPSLKEKLVSLADEKGIGYQTLIQEYLAERVDQEMARK